jgi:sulfonate transport system ATP-binding protein
MLIGLEPVTQGEIRINGEPVRGVGKERGIVFQEPRLFPWLTVIDNVMLGLADEKLSRGVKRQRALAMLERVQLQEFAHALPSRLSGGMAQRVAIARGLIASPQILMLDEPFGALDALTRHTLQQELLHIHRSAGTTTLLVTHDVEEAVALADRVVVLSPRPGRIREVVTLALPHPRQRDDESFSAACRQIRNLITCA